MRLPVASPLLVLLAACGVNPAYESGGGGASADGSASADSTGDASPSTGDAAASATSSSTSTAEPTTAVDPTTAPSFDPSTTTDTTGATVKDPACPDDPDLIACYTFEGDDPFVLRDGSGNGHHGQMTAASLVPSAAPEFGSAVQLGNRVVIDVPDAPALSPDVFTISLLARLAPGDGPQVLLDKHDQITLAATGNELNCAVRTADDVVGFASAYPPLETWLHVVCAYDGGTIRVVARDLGQSHNGEKAHSGALAPSDGMPLAIGRHATGDDAMLGQVDHVLLFSRALTTPELCALGGPFCGG